VSTWEVGVLGEDSMAVGKTRCMCTPFVPKYVHISHFEESNNIKFDQIYQKYNVYTHGSTVPLYFSIFKVGLFKPGLDAPLGLIPHTLPPRPCSWCKGLKRRAP
jgi:hypothetical protein